MPSCLRLLCRKPNGKIEFYEVANNPTPAYAILSHTWGEEEVLFEDIKTSRAQRKAGWRKIEFCAKQAAADGLKYFWIDTCCIDKTNSVELQEAITSMFKWYRGAARCYAYLSDVHSEQKQNAQLSQSGTDWKAEFRKSHWQKRGWTLQELIAPKEVDFFNAYGKHLGSKLTLEDPLHEITGIPLQALRGDPVSSFSINERQSWARDRKTTREEDEAYCLQGIFEVSMPTVYGEGKDNARRRLDEAILRSLKGLHFEEFSVELDVLSIPEAAGLVGREDILEYMHEHLCQYDHRSTVILHGLGGIGKTRLAIAYALQHREQHTAILWLNATGYDTLKQSFRDAARQILRQHPLSAPLAGLDPDADVDLVVNAVKAWLDLEKNRRWLLIYDNYDTPKLSDNDEASAVDLSTFVPRTDHGSIIITTRSAEVSLGTKSYQKHVQKLPSGQQGIQVLANTSERPHLADESGAVALADKLDGLPLALSTAGAYLKRSGISCADYLRHHETSWAKLQERSPKLSNYHSSMYTTWQITFDQIRRQNPASATLLKFWAYFDRQDVWYELLRPAGELGNSSLQLLADDELRFNEAMSLLCSYGLVESGRFGEQQQSTASYSVHTCVHSWMESVLNPQTDSELAKASLHCVAGLCDRTNESDGPALERRLLQHALRQARPMQLEAASCSGMAGDLRSIGWHFYHEDKLLEAEAVWERALRIWTGERGTQDEDTLDMMVSLGDLHRLQGRLFEAENLVDQTLQGYDELDVLAGAGELRAVHTMALIYYAQDRYAEAEEMAARALAGNVDLFGPESSAALHSAKLIGMIYGHQGKLVESEELLLRALRGMEKGLGQISRLTVEIVADLAVTYMLQGRLPEAEEILTSTLQRATDWFGARDRSRTELTRGLGQLHLIQGRLHEAEEELASVVAVMDETLGHQGAEANLNALQAMLALGFVYAQTRQTDMARAMYQRAHAGFRKVVGASSRDCRFIEESLQQLQDDCPTGQENEHGEREGRPTAHETYVASSHPPEIHQPRQRRAKIRLAQRLKGLLK